MEAPAEYLTQEIKDNVIQKLEYFLSKLEVGNQDDKDLVVVTFGDHEADTAEFWLMNTPEENIPFTEHYNDYPLIPVPANYRPGHFERYYRKLRKFIREYRRVHMSRMAPILHLINLGTHERPRMNLFASNKRHWGEDNGSSDSSGLESYSSSGSNGSSRADSSAAPASGILVEGRMGGPVDSTAGGSSRTPRGGVGRGASTSATRSSRTLAEGRTESVAGGLAGSSSGAREGSGEGGASCLGTHSSKTLTEAKTKKGSLTSSSSSESLRSHKECQRLLYNSSQSLVFEVSDLSSLSLSVHSGSLSPVGDSPSDEQASDQEDDSGKKRARKRTLDETSSMVSDLPSDEEAADPFEEDDGKNPGTQSSTTQSSGEKSTPDVETKKPCVDDQ